MTVKPSEASKTEPSKGEGPKFHAMIGGERRGPFGLDELPEAGVRPSTYVWTRGMADWEQAADVAEICRYFRIRLHDKMHPSKTLPVLAADAVQEEKQPSGRRLLPGRLPGEEDFPTAEELLRPADPHSKPGVPMALAVVAAVFFPPLGWVGLRQALRSRKAWREEKPGEAHELAVSAKMWTGISLFIGLGFWASLVIGF